MQQTDRAGRRGSRHFDKLQALDLARAARLLATVKKRVDSLPAEKKKVIFGMHDTLGPATANLWNFKIIMIRCAVDAGLMAEDRHGQDRVASARGAYDAPAALQAVLLTENPFPVGRERNLRNPWLRCADAAVDTGPGGWRPLLEEGTPSYHSSGPFPRRAALHLPLTAICHATQTHKPNRHNSGTPGH